MFTSSAQISYETNSEILFRLYDQLYEPEDREFAHHAHSDFQISLCTTGRGIYLVDNIKELPIAPGCVFFFKGDQPHSIKHINPGEHIHLKTIHFRPQYVLSLGHSDLDAGYLNTFLSEKELPCLIPPQAYEASTIAGLLNEIEGEGNLKRPFYQNMVKAKFLSILAMINRFSGVEENFAEKSPSLASMSVPEIFNSMQYINAHLLDKLTIDQLAEHAGMSKSYYSHIFKKLNGTSPIDYIISKRIELSRSALKRTDDNILDIAKKYGFNNTANYNRAFKLKTGMTPSEFRKRSRSEDITDW